MTTRNRVHEAPGILSFPEAMAAFGSPGTSVATALMAFNERSSRMGINKIAITNNKETIVPALHREDCAEILSPRVDLSATIAMTESRVAQLKVHRGIYVTHLKKCVEEIDVLTARLVVLKEQQSAHLNALQERKTG